MIGFDTETRPNLVNYHDPNKVSILQLANETLCYIFDMKALYKNRKFDNLMNDIFSSPNVKKAGFACGGDLAELKRDYPKMRAWKNATGIVDVQKLYNEKDQVGLDAVF